MLCMCLLFLFEFQKSIILLVHVGNSKIMVKQMNIFTIIFRIIPQCKFSNTHTQSTFCPHIDGTELISSAKGLLDQTCNGEVDSHSLPHCREPRQCQESSKAVFDIPDPKQLIFRTTATKKNQKRFQVDFYPTQVQCSILFFWSFYFFHSFSSFPKSLFPHFLTFICLPLPSL